jgi:hypothetical protein
MFRSGLFKLATMPAFTAASAAADQHRFRPVKGDVHIAALDIADLG